MKPATERIFPVDRNYFFKHVEAGNRFSFHILTKRDIQSQTISSERGEDRSEGCWIGWIVRRLPAPFFLAWSIDDGSLASINIS